MITSRGLGLTECYDSDYNGLSFTNHYLEAKAMGAASEDSTRKHALILYYTLWTLKLISWL